MEGQSLGVPLGALWAVIFARRQDPDPRGTIRPLLGGSSRSIYRERVLR